MKNIPSCSQIRAVYPPPESEDIQYSAGNAAAATMATGDEPPGR